MRRADSVKDKPSMLSAAIKVYFHLMKLHMNVKILITPFPVQYKIYNACTPLLSVAIKMQNAAFLIVIERLSNVAYGG